MSRQDGILRLRHLREHTEARGEAMADDRGRFAALTGEQAAPRAVSAFNLFQTPPELAARMASMLGPCERILEPSAGLGRLYRAIRDNGHRGPVTLVEQSPECCRELYAITEGAGVTLRQGDFLEMQLGEFDGIIMNPPFKMRRDIKHILRAREMLAPGGTLVALCYNGTRQQAKLQPVADYWEPLPAETFRSEGTRAQAVLLVISN